MKYEYNNPKEESCFSISCFNELMRENKFVNDDCYRIVWSKNGKFEAEIDSINYKLEKNELFFLTPVNKIRDPKYLENVVVFSFNREFYCIQTHDKEVSCIGYLFFGSSNIQLISLGEDELRKMNILYSVFIEEFENADHIQGEMLQILLKRLIILSTRIARKNLTEPDISKNKLDVIRKFNVLVEKNFKKKHKVSDYAEILNKSPKTLSNLFAKYNNKTPLQIIQERKTLEAKRMLIYTDFSSKEIAYELGFEDAAHFSRFFKNQVQISPSEFRKIKLSDFGKY